MKLNLIFLLFFVIHLFFIHLSSCDESFAQWKAERASTVDAIMKASLENTQGYSRMQYMADTFGVRVTGTQGLSAFIDWSVATMLADGVLASVAAEPVPVRPNWVRSRVASLALHSTQTEAMELGVTALGGSIGTPPGAPLLAEAVVLRSFEEAEAAGEARIKGKIVVWNQEWRSYGYASSYRVDGASVAARYGAVASLTRSLTGFSLYTLHTGTMSYAAGVPRIPAAAITVEDAELLQRMQARGQPIVLELALGCYNEERNGLSHNVLAELRGAELPDEFVVVGAHIDAWTRGAHDDGGNFVAAWEALNVLAAVGARPRRGIRVVGFTSEEWGQYSEVKGQAGAWAYFAAHLAELQDTAFAMEADMGVFAPRGLSFQGSNQSAVALQDLADLLRPTLALSVARTGGTAADIAPLCNAGVPGAGVQVEGDGRDGQYWWYHHALSDQAAAVTHGDFNRMIATFAGISYLVADLPFRLVGDPK